jgi:hypothetical protein
MICCKRDESPKCLWDLLAEALKVSALKFLKPFTGLPGEEIIGLYCASYRGTLPVRHIRLLSSYLRRFYGVKNLALCAMLYVPCVS